MRINGSYVLPFGRARAYEKLHDPEVLSRCVPACERLEKIGPDEYAAQVKLTLDVLVGVFGGRIQITEARPPESFKMVVEGSGILGFLKGEGMVQLKQAGVDATELMYDGDLQVGGSVASAGQRKIDAMAKVLIGEFFEGFVKVAGDRG